MTATSILLLAVMVVLFTASFGFKRLPFKRIGNNIHTMMATTLTKPVKTISLENAVTHPSYELIEKTMIEEYGVLALLYKHLKSGAEVLSIVAPDENKVFGITLRTPPKDSTGVPHILEHSVLCGSRKFKSKEPFVDLLKGSLQTFLNAFTYPDRTCYPVASMNTKDFYNLINVYLDAVLHPRAVSDPLVLQQEGWHYELEDKNQPLTYKGVVYNEMKGVYSSPDSLMGRATQQALFPNNAYSVDSGGDPVDIPNLTFDQFKDFHSKYYHPSNSRVYFYGDDDPLKRLELLDEYLSEFNAIEVTSAIAYQPKLTMPQQKIEVPFPVTTGTPPKHMVTVNWLLNDTPLTEKERLALGVLDTLLMGTASAVLRKTLTESQLGESVMGGMSDELIQTTFGAGMKGVKPENVDKVEELVLTTLKKAAVDGFEKDAVKAAMNSLEFSLREFNTGSFPRGLSLMLGILSQWIYDRDPFSGVRFEAALKELKEDLAANKPIFQELLNKYILSNTHRITVEAKPDTELEARVASNESNLLNGIKDSLSASQIEDIIESTRKLKQAQEAEDSPEAKATLPRLSIEDIDRTAKELPIEVEVLPDATILTHSVQSNGILYLDIGFDFSEIADEDLVLLPLFTRMLTETGTGKYSEDALTHLIGAETGGISASYSTDLKSNGGKVVDPSNVSLYFVLRGKSTQEKIPTLFTIVKDILLDANLKNQKRALEMLKETKVRRETQIITSGHTYGATRLAARYSLFGYIGEKTGGLTFVRELSGLIEAVEKDWPSVEKRLLAMRDTIFKKSKAEKLIINLTGEDKVLTAAKPAVSEFLGDLPSRSLSASSLVHSFSASKLLPTTNEGFSVPSQVNYVVKGGSIYSPGEAVKGSTSVVAKYLSTGYLWDNVRVMGGAYGGFARFGEASGRFVYMSYRDPNLANTLSIYDKAAEALESAVVTKEDVLQAVIGCIGDLDSPLSPDQKGYVSMSQYISGESATDRQNRRNEVIDTAPGDFKEFAKRLATLKDTGSTVVFGSQAALDQANEVLGTGSKLKVEPAIQQQPQQ